MFFYKVDKQNSMLIAITLKKSFKTWNFKIYFGNIWCVIEHLTLSKIKVLHTVFRKNQHTLFELNKLHGMKSKFPDRNDLDNWDRVYQKISIQTRSNAHQVLHPSIRLWSLYHITYCSRKSLIDADITYYN